MEGASQPNRISSIKKEQRKNFSAALFVYAQQLVDGDFQYIGQVREFVVRHNTVAGFDSADGLLRQAEACQLNFGGELFLG